jgi:hypothetical protein
VVVGAKAILCRSLPCEGHANIACGGLYITGNVLFSLMLRHCFLGSSAHCGGECCSACYGAAACLSQLWKLRRRRREAKALKYHSASHRQVVQSPTGHCLHKIESHIELEFSLERAGVNYEPAGLKRIAKCITPSIIEKQRPPWLPSPSQAGYFQDLDQTRARPRVCVEDGIIRRS